MNTPTTTEIGSVSHEQAVLDNQLPVDEILDRFTLALARRMAREDHDETMKKHSTRED
jgi:hypothetical protein